MNRILTVGFIVLLAIGFSTCKHEVIELPPQGGPFVPPPDTTPDTVNFKPCHPDTVYFDRDVLPILKSNCTSCHETAVDSNQKVDLSSYFGVMNGGKTIVIPDSASESKLYKSVRQTDPLEDNYMPRPVTINRLTETEILIIKDWINQGAKQLFCDECDTLVSYTESVAPIFFTNCKGCHAENSNNPPVPALWFIKANPTSSADVIHAKLESIGGGKLKAAFNGTIPPPSKLTVMPPSGKIDTCSITIIEDWVNAGMPE